MLSRTIRAVLALSLVLSSPAFAVPAGSSPSPVTSVGAGCGAATGGATTGAVTISSTQPLDTVSSASPSAFVAGDCGKTKWLTNSSAKTVTLPAASAIGAGGYIDFCNANTGAAAIGRAGSDTIAGGTSAYSLAAGTASAPVCARFIADTTSSWQVTFVAGGSGGGGSSTAFGAYTTGNYYTPLGISQTQNGVAGGNGELTCYAGHVGQAVHIDSLSVFVLAAGAGTFQLAVYTNVNGRPGTKLASTSSLTPSANAAVTGSISSTALPAGPVWFCHELSDATTSFISMASGSQDLASLMGSASLGYVNGGANNINDIACYTTCGGSAYAYGTWPSDLSTSTTWIENGPGRYAPLMSFHVSSVP